MTLPDINALSERDDADGIQQQVVGAVIDRGGEVLFLQRPDDDWRGGTWELPSGKVEPGEGLIAGLHREVQEETGLQIAEITGYLGAFDYVSGSGKRSRQHTWSVTVVNAGAVRLTEHDAHAWAAADDAPPVSSEVENLVNQHFQAASA
ncbi:NUDIX domain-containing protein [Saccharopolyspora sp. NPDC003752]